MEPTLAQGLLDIAGALHVLEDGDQVEIGGSARLKFERVI